MLTSKTQTSAILSLGKCLIKISFRKLCKTVEVFHKDQKKGFTKFLVNGLAFAMVTPGFSEKTPIIIDGQFDDWSGVPIAITDAQGDVADDSVDFVNLWLAEDDRFLFIRIETGTIIDPSENNSLVLFIDGGSGRVLEWQLGNRQGIFRVDGSEMENNVRYADIGFRGMPTLDSNDLELAIRLDAKPDGITDLFSGTTLKIRFEDIQDGDRIPNEGDGVSYTLGEPGGLLEETVIDFERTRTSDLRVATYNILNDNIFDSTLAHGFRRQLQAVNPDIIHFQEIRSNSADRTRAVIEDWLPLHDGQTWFAIGGSTSERDTVTVSRFPILDHWGIPSISSSGSQATLIDTTTHLGTEIFLINTHLPSGANDVSRQNEVDAIMTMIRSAKSPGGFTTLAPNTPIVFGGDMNFVGRIEQLKTLLTGDISRNNVYGPDFSPDWDGTHLTSITPRHTDQRMGYTWRSDQENNFWPGHLDYWIYSDSVLDMIKSYVVHPPSMTADRLSRYNLQSNDSQGSDHLLFVVDFRPSFVDTDENGLPDYWEHLTFGGTGQTNASADTDFDGANNLEEFLTGTNPNDNNSFLRISAIQTNEDEVFIHWKTVVDRIYRVQITFDLQNWVDLYEPIQGTGQLVNQLLPREFADQVFYRLLVN